MKTVSWGFYPKLFSAISFVSFDIFVIRNFVRKLTGEGSGGGGGVKRVGNRRAGRETYTVKKRLSISPSPGGVSLTKLCLAWNYEIFPGQGEFGQ
jgi:hypothetical protein